MQRLAKGILAAAVLGFGVFWWLTTPATPPAVAITNASENLDNGERVFWASGCASCHAADGATGDNKLLLVGGHRLETPFGTFVAPNISPDPENGTGNWTLSQFAHAMRAGVSPTGKHYYPAFPYASYAAMTDTDVRDLFAFLQTLPAVEKASEPHELALPFQWRRPVGIWKVLFADQRPALALDRSNAQLVRGEYLVETLGHCGECHTPRNLLGGMKTADWLAGGAAPSGPGRIPNITPHENGLGGWSAGDIVYYLESGFTPDFDSVGGTMTSVQQNMAKLPREDLEAIAAYLKAVPPVPSN